MQGLDTEQDHISYTTASVTVDDNRLNICEK